MLADERARSARDLHDGLGHRLSIISMSLAFAERMRDPDRAPDTGRQPDRPATLFLHRFVQEGLTNALRHSAAASATSSAAPPTGGGSSACATTARTARRTGPSHGFGLRSLAERAADLGGSVSTAWSASGFELSARLPP